MAPKAPPKFDQARLQEMTEPLTVRVERVKGNSRSQIPLPPKEGYAVGGPGWTAEEVMGLEQWTVKEWSGGGTYIFQVTDSSQPAKTMEWTQVFNYPEKVPPIMADAVAAVPPVLQQQSMPQSATPWPPPAQQWQGMGPVAVPQAPAPTPWGTPPAWGAPMPWGGPFGPTPYYPPQPSSTPIPGKGSEVDQLKAENERLRLQQQEERHQAQMRAQDEAHRQQMEALRAEIRQANAKPTGPDPAMIERIEREREARLEAERARERAEWEAKIAAMNAQKPQGSEELAILRQQLADQQRRFEEETRRRDEEARHREETRRRDDELRLLREEMRANANKGPDPMITMIIDSMRQQTEAQKEMARLNTEAAKEAARANADALRELKSQMVHPAEMFRMVRDASSGQDQIISSTVSTLNNVFNTAQQWMTSIMQQMGGGGESPVVRLIEGGLERAQAMADRYFSTKAQAAVASANAQRETARAAAAQAQAYQAQWQAPPPVANASATAAAGAAPAATPAPVGGLNGAAPSNGNGHSKEPVRKGKTDTEWFGPAIDDVKALRTAASDFIVSITSNPPRMQPDGHPVGIGPDQAAQFILMAAQTIEQRKIPGVVAFEVLFAQGMYADLIDVLLPDMPPGYRVDTGRYLHALLEGKTLEQAQAEIEGEPDDDEEDGDDGSEAALVPAQA